VTSERHPAARWRNDGKRRFTKPLNQNLLIDSTMYNPIHIILASDTNLHSKISILYIFHYFEVSRTYRPAILPSRIRSYTFCNSLRPQVLYGALMRPRLKNSMASAESRLLPTYEPLMVIILMTESKTGARR